MTATTRTDARASFSNFGRRSVLLGAPGASILSTTPGNGYAFFNGTSMATPHVTGVAALLKAHDAALDWHEIKNLIVAGGDPVPALANTVAQRRLSAHGALVCTSSPVLSRLLPVGASATGAVGTPIDLAALHVNCASPNGTVVVGVTPGGQSVSLADDGIGADRVAGDGIYTGSWTPTAAGAYSFAFPGGDTVPVQVLGEYRATTTSFSYRAIGGTSLDLDDDTEAVIDSPFEVPFGSGRFTQLRVGSNGTVSFTDPFTASANTSMPTAQIATLVAPWWDDLVPVPGTAQNVFWDVLGAAPRRELVVEWRDVRHGGCPAGATITVRLQVVFFEASNDVLFNYADTAFGGACAAADRAGSATVGVQIGTQSAVQYSFNTQSLADGMAILWTMLPPPTLSVSPPRGASGACRSAAARSALSSCRTRAAAS